MIASYFSPAKINLFFCILSKRKDGFHEIASLYQAISFGDHLFFSSSSKLQFTTNHPTLKWDPSNTVFQAVNLFQKRSGIQIQEAIHLNKEIPVEAGLGGGSSNAATTLWALNERYQKPFSINSLMEMGAQIGADVPFFFSKGTAYCKGKGEIFEERTVPPIQGMIIKPSFGVSTKKAYQNVCMEKTYKQNPFTLLSSFEKGEMIDCNDLETSVFNVEPRLQSIKKRLQPKFDHLFMTGSGSAFVGIGKKADIDLKNLSVFSFQSLQKQPNNWFFEKNKIANPL